MNTDNEILIAEFMGFQPTNIGWFDNDEHLTMVEADNTFDFLKFECSWDWLMAVVEKIEGLDFIFSIHHEVVNIFNGECNDLKYNETTQSQTKQITVYNACVEFIKWYNEQPK